MGTKYSSNSASGYNATPPPDDGTVSEANKTKWSTIKTKLADPVKDLADTINTELATHFNNGPTALTTNTTLGATHYNQIIQVSGASVTLTLTDAATLTAGWFCWIVNTDSSNTVTLGRATAGDTINGTAANYSIVAGQTLFLFVNAAANGFITVSDVSLRAANNFISNQSITSTDAGAAQGPVLDLYRDSVSPASADSIGAIDFYGRDSAGNKQLYTRLLTIINDPTSTSEDGKLQIYATIAGTLTLVAEIADGLIFGSPTGSFQGAGTINAVAVYDDGVLLANGWTLLDNQTITAVASVSVTSKITSTYDDYLWIGENITIANDNDTMTFQGSKDNNATNESANYWIGNPNGAMSAGAVAIASLNNSTSLPMDFNLQLFNPLRTSTSKTWLWKGSYPLTGTGVQNTFDKHCMWNETGAGKFFNAFKLSVGSTMSGTFRFYGFKKS